MSALVIHNTHELHQLKKSLAPPPGYSGYLYEKILSCKRQFYFMRPYGFMPSGRFSVFYGTTSGHTGPKSSPGAVPRRFRFGHSSTNNRNGGLYGYYQFCGTITHSIPQNTGKTIFSYLLRNFFKNFFPHPDKCTHPFGICVKGKQELCLLPTGGEGGELLWSNPLFKMSRQSDISLILCASWH